MHFSHWQYAMAVNWKTAQRTGLCYAADHRAETLDSAAQDFTASHGPASCDLQIRLDGVLLHRGK